MKRLNLLPTPESIENSWNFATQKLLHPIMNLVYDYPSQADYEFPSPEEISRVWPNPGGHGTGMEDSMIYGGTLMDAALCRYELTGDSEAAQTAHRITDGLLRCAFAAKSEGFIPRSITPADGKSHYIDTSRDQYTMFVFGLFRYLRSPLCTSAERNDIEKALIGVARRAEKNVTPETGYDMLREDGGPSIVSIMWGEGRSSAEYCRLPMIYLAAWEASQDKHWLDKYREIREEAYERSLPMIRHWHLYVNQQMQAALYVLREADPDKGWYEKYAYVMNQVAEYTLTLTPDFIAFVNQLNRIIGETKNFRDLPMIPREITTWKGLPHFAPGLESQEEMFLLQDVSILSTISAMATDCSPTEEAIQLFTTAIEKFDYDVYRGPAPVHFLQAYYRIRLSLQP